MTISVNTNKSALTALQNLNRTNDELANTQNRVNTGLKIANAKDNAAVWAIAQGQRADIGALGAVRIPPGARHSMGAGPEGAELIAFGAPNTDNKDVDMQPGFFD